MACTTILVGKKASYDGSTMIARNDDSGSGHFTPKKFVVVQKEEQPRSYKSEISHVEIELPDDEKIVVDDVEIPPDESGGGFDGNVSDWDDETNVELPVG